MEKLGGIVMSHRLSMIHSLSRERLVPYNPKKLKTSFCNKHWNKKKKAKKLSKKMRKLNRK